MKINDKIGSSNNLHHVPISSPRGLGERLLETGLDSPRLSWDPVRGCFKYGCYITPKQQADEAGEKPANLFDWYSLLPR